MFAYEMEVPEQKDWDINTFDNLVDIVCDPNATQYLQCANNISGTVSIDIPHLSVIIGT